MYERYTQIVRNISRATTYPRQTDRKYHALKAITVELGRQKDATSLKSDRDGEPMSDILNNEETFAETVQLLEHC